MNAPSFIPLRPEPSKREAKLMKEIETLRGTVETRQKFRAEIGGKKPAADFGWQTAETASAPVLIGHWLIKKFLPQEGMAVMFGRPGCGKSFVALDLMLHIAEGTPWRGVKTKQAAVTYIASEGGVMGVNRVHAFMREHSRPWPSGFRMSPLALDLRSTPQDRDRLIADIRAAQPECGLVVIDTLNRNIGGGDENSPEDMGAFVGHCDAIAKALNCLVLIIHHSGKDEAKGSRGHSSLVGAIDLEIEITRRQGEAGKIHVTKLRNGEDGQEWGFLLKGVYLGDDEDGEAVKSAVVISADAPEVCASPGGKVQRAVQEAFIQFSLDHGVPNPAGTGFPAEGRVKVVDMDAFVEFAAGKVAAKDRNQAKKDVRRAINGLVERRCLASNEGKLWFLI